MQQLIRLADVHFDHINIMLDRAHHFILFERIGFILLGDAFDFVGFDLALFLVEFDFYIRFSSQ